ncbi:potassium channel family protein [Mycoplasma elephantis]|uniref:potassium channel family protein n=1 Tax=Mycoplasma elephantis TaxID=114882 RepID=UPI00048064B9|nr:TrkA family potassium uptake protein [Mycoplasma elephantis]
MKMKKDICVIGAGRYGQAIIEQLNKLNYPVLVLDKDEKALQAISDLATNVYALDAADMKALNAISIKEVSTVIVASPDNLEIVAALLELKVKNIIVRATSRRHARVLKQIGVHMIVRPEYEAGVRTALIATNPNFIHYSKNLNEIGHNFVMGSTNVYNKDFENKELKELNLYDQGINIVFVSREGKGILPVGTTKLLRNDNISFVGSIADATKFMAIINLENEKKLED